MTTTTALLLGILIGFFGFCGFVLLMIKIDEMIDRDDEESEREAARIISETTGLEYPRALELVKNPPQ